MPKKETDSGFERNFTRAAQMKDQLIRNRTCGLQPCDDDEGNHFAPRPCHIDPCYSYSHSASEGPDLRALCGFGPRRQHCNEVVDCSSECHDRCSESSESCCYKSHCVASESCGRWCGKDHCKSDKWCGDNACCGYESSYCHCKEDKYHCKEDKYHGDVFSKCGKKGDAVKQITGKLLTVSFGSAAGATLEKYSPEGVLYVNGKQAPRLHLKKGQTYLMKIDGLPASAGKFIITDSPMGGAGSNVYASAMSGSTLMLSVTKDMPKHCYYQLDGMKFAGGLILIH